MNELTKLRDLLTSDEKEICRTYSHFMPDLDCYVTDLTVIDLHKLFTAINVYNKTGKVDNCFLASKTLEILLERAFEKDLKLF